MRGYEEIKELKQMLDEGLITQEDFDRKKSELLDAASTQGVGAPVGSVSAWDSPNSRTEKEKSKWIAGLTAIFLGGFGIHKFYLGYASQGAILLAATLVLALPISLIAQLLRIIPLIQLVGMLAYVPMLIGIAEGVVYLTKSDENFRATYVTGRREWF